MFLMTATDTDFAPITFNGEPIITFRMLHHVEISGRLYAQEYAASEDCDCRRCLLHEDFGGCIVADALWEFVECLMGLTALVISG